MNIFIALRSGSCVELHADRRAHHPELHAQLAGAERLIHALLYGVVHLQHVGPGTGEAFLGPFSGGVDSHF